MFCKPRLRRLGSAGLTSKPSRKPARANAAGSALARLAAARLGPLLASSRAKQITSHTSQTVELVVRRPGSLGQWQGAEHDAAIPYQTTPQMPSSSSCWLHDGDGQPTAPGRSGNQEILRLLRRSDRARSQGRQNRVCKRLTVGDNTIAFASRWPSLAQMLHENDEAHLG